MKKCIITLFCIVSSSLLWATNYYVDNSAAGSNNGTSWVNAWESFAAINWSNIQPGDIIYISGGSSSKTYNDNIVVNASGSSGSPITIMKGIDAGYNGEVIIQGSGSGNGISIFDKQWITVRNLTINDWGINVKIDGGSSNATHHIIIDNCDGRMSGRFVHIEGYPDQTGSYTHDITVRYCDVTTPAFIGNQNDFVYAQYMAGLTIENNNVDISNNDTSPHNDMVQTFWVDGPVIVRNNYFEHSDTKLRNSQGIFFENHEGTFEVYNNIIVMPNSLDGKIYWKVSSLNNAHTIIYSNVSYGRSGSLIKTTDPNAVIKNNILYSTGYQSNGSTYMLEFNGVSGSGADVANNLFYDPAGNMNNMNSGTNQNGVEGNPLFTNISGRDFTLQTGSPAIDAGATLQSPYNVDIIGTSRPQGPLFDIGAYEIITGGGGNNPPNQPSNPNPANGAIDQPVNLTLTWSCTDPDGDPLTYDVYFGISSNPPLALTNQSSASYTPGQLNNSTTYYWKIVAKDNQGATTTGPIWNFTTEAGGGGNNPPNQPSNPNPANGAIDQPVNLILTWSCTDPDGDPLTYDVYFGTSSNPPIALTNQSSASFNPGQLNNSITYYWKILARDNQGATTTGPIWNFTTEAVGGGDIIPPELIGIQIAESDQVVLDFSEPLDEGQVSNLGNYIISEQMQVIAAELNASYQRITLTTDQHIVNHIYTIVINNLTDLAGNVISSQANSAFYKQLDLGSSGYVEHLIENVDASATTDTNTSPQKTLDGLINGDPDPNSRWAAETMPQWIQYDLGAVENINLIAITFFRWNAGRIYEYSIRTSNDENNWNEIVSNTSSSSQEWTFNEFETFTARYIRVICLSSNEADWAGLWEARIFEPDYPTTVVYTIEPQTYALEQNYPNPFNPATKIKYTIPIIETTQGAVFTTLKIYDILGNEVATLVNEEKSAGTYEVTFNANDFVSGVYFYQLTAGEFSKSLKMLYLK